MPRKLKNANFFSSLLLSKSSFVLLLLAAALVGGGYSYLPLRQTIAYGLGISGDRGSCCDSSLVEQSKGDYEPEASVAFFNNMSMPAPQSDLAAANIDPRVLGTRNDKGEEKWIEVSLQNQEMVLFEGHTKILATPISSGKWFPTPKGTFYIWYKTRNQRMEGGSKALGTYYNLPNVPHNMFFYGGYAIHGAYWHNNFGQPMSHGCVNTPLDKVDDVFAWTGPVVPEGQNYVKASPENPGTRVWVH